jgi:MFS superfamily sulfate permease-like transporter
MIGGLPMIAEIVRSSANVSFGAKTWRSNFFHGLVILLAVLVLPKALNLIPLSALAAILVMIGWRLGNPKHLLHAWGIGRDNVVGFAVTMIITLAEDLLVGIFCGVIAQYIVEMILGLKIKNAFKPEFKETEQRDEVFFEVEGSLIFSNFLQLKEEVMKLAQAKKNVKMDLTHCDYIDHSVMEQLEELKSFCESAGIKFVVDLSHHHSLGHDALSSLKKDT